MKRSLKILAAVLSIALLASCGNKPDETDKNPSIPDDFLVSTEKNTPDKVVGHYDPDAAVTKAPDSDQADVTPSSDEPSNQNDAENSSSLEENGDAPAQTEPEDSLPDTEAMKYLKKLNSKHVHAKLTHMYSFDGDELMSAEREYFIEGDRKIYVNDGNKTFVKDGMITYLDRDSEVYYSYPNDLEDGPEFGFEAEKYVLISQESGADGSSELYSINGERLTSTWEFLEDGRVKVSDRNLDSPAFDYYIFEVIEEDGFELDFTIPENYTEVDAELYGN